MVLRVSGWDRHDYDVDSNATAATVTGLVERLASFDSLEADHRHKTLTWLGSTNDVFRRAKPTTPVPHLVSYFVLLDQAKRRILLVEHRLAGLWLPAGGHVEPGEHPIETVRRESREELGIEARLLNEDEKPVFLTWTQTVGHASHIDVSLWFLLHGSVDEALAWDRGEFTSIRWWSPSEVRNSPSGQFDPHMSRFLAKIDTAGIWERAR